MSRSELMIGSETMDEHQRRLRRTYGISLHFSLSPWALWPWWATMTHGTGCVGDFGAGVWHARTREKLIAKCERWARRDARSKGIPVNEIVIKIREHEP